MFRIRLNSVATFIGAGAIAACGSDPVVPPAAVPDVIAVVSGDQQSAATGQTLGNALVVLVTNSSAAVAGANVTWTVASGGGTVNPATGTTDASGQASTNWTLGANAGAQMVTAAVGGATGSPITFTATGNAPPPATATVSIGDNFFNAATQPLAVGGTITWNWAGNNTHNVTFTTGTNSTTQNAGSFARTFTTAGSFGYLCTIHGSSMSGTIVVQ
jgi:plastocyanin